MWWEQPTVAITAHSCIFLPMAAPGGLPASPPFQNAAMNAFPALNTPAVAAGAVDMGVVGVEGQRKRKLAFISACSNGEVITTAEVGEAACREARDCDCRG